MDAWAWSDHLAPWLAARVELPIGALFCVIDGPTRGRPWSATAARGELRRYAAAAGVRRRFARHQLRHAHAVELAREGGAAAGDPAPARAFVRLDHERLPSRDPCRGDHRHDPCATRADDACQRRPRALKTWPSRTGGRKRCTAQPPAGPALTRPLFEIAEARAHAAGLAGAAPMERCRRDCSCLSDGTRGSGSILAAGSASKRKRGRPVVRLPAPCRRFRERTRCWPRLGAWVSNT